MTERRMKKLLCELNLAENSVYVPDTDTILKGVKNKIAEGERKPVLKMSFSKAVAIAFVVILMLALTTVVFGHGGVFRFILNVFEIPEKETELPTVESESVQEVTAPVENEATDAETETEAFVNPNYESPIINKYYKEEVEETKEYVHNADSSVEDDNYILTLNEFMGDSRNLYLTVTIEAKNNEANSLLRDKTYGWSNIEAYDEIYGWSGVSSAVDEIVNQRREFSRSYTVHVFGDDRLKNGYGKMRITCSAFSPDMETERYIYFEIEKKEDVIEFELLGQPFTGGYVYVTPMSIEITKPKEPTDEYAPWARNLNTFFKFKNGMVKTYNQVAGFDSGSSLIEGDEKLYKFSAGTKTVLDIDQLESIIVNDIEYPVSDPKNYTEAYIPQNLKPFVSNSPGMRKDEIYYPCTLKQLSNCINIIYEENSAAEFEYGGKRYRTEAGSLSVTIEPGGEYTLYIAPYADENGDLWISGDFLLYLLGIRRDEIGQTGTYLMVP